jgi:HEAT repeat protein
VTNNVSSAIPGTRPSVVLFVVKLASLALLLVAAAIGVIFAPSYVQVRNAISSVEKYRDGNAEIHDLGGPAKAIRKLSFYLRLPPVIAPGRDYAVSLLGECGEEAAALLADLTKDADPKVRIQAVICTAMVHHPDACDVISRALADDDHKVRLVAVQLLGDLGDLRAVKPLRDLLSDQLSKELHGEAQKALGKLQGTAK